MNKIDIAKKATQFIVGTGASKIVHDIISNNINNPENVASKVTTYTGAAVLGMMVADHSKEYVGTKIDELVAAFKKANAHPEIVHTIHPVQTQE